MSPAVGAEDGQVKDPVRGQQPEHRNRKQQCQGGVHGGEEIGPSSGNIEDDGEHRLGCQQGDQGREPKTPEAVLQDHYGFTVKEQQRSHFLPQQQSDEEREKHHRGDRVTQRNRGLPRQGGERSRGPRGQPQILPARSVVLDDRKNQGEPEADLHHRSEGVAERRTKGLGRIFGISCHPEHHRGHEGERHHDRQHPFQQPPPVQEKVRSNQVEGAVRVAGGQPHGISELGEDKAFGFSR